MNWEAIGAIGEVAGAVAVVATMIYLAAQIRENTKSNLTASHQALTQASAHLASQTSGDAGLARISAKANSQGLSVLDEEEATRFAALCSQTFVLFETAFLLHANGSIDAGFFESKLESLSDLLLTKGMMEMWAVQRRWQEPVFRQYVDDLIDQRSDA